MHLNCHLSFLVLIAYISSQTSLAKVKFPKEQRMDLPFPSKISLPISPGVPIGHLRPLGHHRRSDGEVPRLPFKNWDGKSPIFAKSLLSRDTNIRLWPNDEVESDSSLSTKIWVTKRVNSEQSVSTLMSLEKFYEDYSSEEWIADQVIPQSLVEKIPMPSEFSYLAKNIFFASSTLSSGTTSDIAKLSWTMNSLQCVLDGRKDYIILKSKTTVPTYKLKSQIPCDVETAVHLNPDLINLFSNPWVSSLSWKHTSLFQGDCILIPSGYIYHTTSYGHAEAVNFIWHKRFNKKSNNKTTEDNRVASIQPLVCPTNDNKNITLCDNTQLSKEEHWRNFLLSLTDEEDLLHKSCFVDVAEKKDLAEELYSMLTGDTPVTGDALSHVSSDILSNILNQHVISYQQHIHDEL